MKNMVMAITVILFMSGCATQYRNQSIVGKPFPPVNGKTLANKSVAMPNDFLGKPTLLLIGYKQNSQFDIDRWLIGLDMRKADVDVYELPTMQGILPSIFRTMIDNGMRNGIPESLWHGVITLYDDGEQVQAFTGNQNPNNARVVLLDDQGVVRYFYDQGFAVSALNALALQISVTQAKTAQAAVADPF